MTTTVTDARAAMARHLDGTDGGRRWEEDAVATPETCEGPVKIHVEWPDGDEETFRYDPDYPDCLEVVLVCPV